MIMYLTYSIYLVFFFVQNIEGQVDSCRPGWLRFHHSCYLFSRQKLSWSEAEFDCQIYGAKLAEIETVDEEGSLRTHLIDNYAKEADIKGFWLGATDDQKEGQWVWIKDRTLVGYSNWAPGEPNNKDNEEHCLEFWAEQTFRWNDAPCRLKRRFICEEALDVATNQNLNPVVIGK